MDFFKFRKFESVKLIPCNFRFIKKVTQEISRSPNWSRRMSRVAALPRVRVPMLTSVTTRSPMPRLKNSDTKRLPLQLIKGRRFYLSWIRIVTLKNYFSRVGCPWSSQKVFLRKFVKIKTHLKRKRGVKIKGTELFNGWLYADSKFEKVIKRNRLVFVVRFKTVKKGIRELLKIIPHLSDADLKIMKNV